MRQRNETGMLKTLATVAIAVAMAYGTQAQADLLLHYDFDETSGAAVNDGTVGTSANATLQGSITRSADTPGGFGSSLNVAPEAGNDSGADAGAVSQLDGKNTFTVTFWLKMTGTPTANQRILGNRSTSPNEGLDIYVNNPDTGSIASNNLRLFYTHSGVGSQTTDIDASDWVFVAFVMDGSVANPNDNLTIYTGDDTNAISVNITDDVYVSTVPPTTLTSPAEFWMGGADDLGGNRTPPALLDDVRIYDEVLTQSQLDDVRLSNIPEPATVALLGAGASLMAARRRKARRA